MSLESFCLHVCRQKCDCHITGIGENKVLSVGYLGTCSHTYKIKSRQIKGNKNSNDYPEYKENEFTNRKDPQMWWHINENGYTSITIYSCWRPGKKEVKVTKLGKTLSCAQVVTQEETQHTSNEVPLLNFCARIKSSLTTDSVSQLLVFPYFLLAFTRVLLHSHSRVCPRITILSFTLCIYIFIYY